MEEIKQHVLLNIYQIPVGVWLGNGIIWVSNFWIWVGTQHNSFAAVASIFGVVVALTSLYKQCRKG